MFQITRNYVCTTTFWMLEFFNYQEVIVMQLSNSFGSLFLFDLSFGFGKWLWSVSNVGSVIPNSSYAKRKFSR